MKKFRLYYDKDAETKWLNEMAEQGWAMISFFAGVYTFEKCEKGEWIYQVDFGEKFGAVTQDYREFMEESGIEIIQSWGYWVLLRKKASEGEFVLYTDVESSIEHYTKILRMFKVVTVLEIICLFIELYGAVSGIKMGWVFTFIIMAILLALINAVTTTKNTINELKSRQSGIGVEKKQGVSPLLTVGLLFNACGMGAINSDTLSDPLKRIIMIVAIVFMLAGIYKTAAMRRE